MIYQATHFEDVRVTEPDEIARLRRRDSADDRRVRQHVHECAECAAALDELAARQ